MAGVGTLVDPEEEVDIEEVIEASQVPMIGWQEFLVMFFCGLADNCLVTTLSSSRPSTCESSLNFENK